MTYKKLNMENLSNFEQKKSLVYFILTECNYVKIGVTINAKVRIPTIQKSSGRRIKEVVYVNGSYKTEKYFHNLYSSERYNGEWFILDFEEVKKDILKTKAIKERKPKGKPTEEDIKYFIRLFYNCEKKENIDLLWFVKKYGDSLLRNRNILKEYINDKEEIIKMFGDSEYYEELEVIKSFENEFDYVKHNIRFVGFEGFPKKDDELSKNQWDLFESYIFKDITKDEFLHKYNNSVQLLA